MKTLQEIAGLIPAGKDDEGDQLWLGTDQQWDQYRYLEKLWEERGNEPVSEEKINELLSQEEKAGL